MECFLCDRLGCKTAAPPLQGQVVLPNHFARLDDNDWRKNQSDPDRGSAMQPHRSSLKTHGPEADARRIVAVDGERS